MASQARDDVNCDDGRDGCERRSTGLWPMRSTSRVGEMRYFDTSSSAGQAQFTFLRSKLGNAKQGCATSQHTSGGSRTQPVKPDAIHRLPSATPRKCQSASAILPSSLPLRSPHARWEDAAASTRGSRPESPTLSRIGPGAFRPTRRPDPAPPSMKSSCGSGRDSASSPPRRMSRPRNRHPLSWTPFTEPGGKAPDLSP